MKSTSPGTRKLAETPTRFHVTVVPNRPFLVIPEVSSEKRDYVPIGWLKPPTIPSNLVRVLAGCRPVAFRRAHIRHAHGVASPDRRTPREPTTATPSGSSTTHSPGRKPRTSSEPESARSPRRSSMPARSFRAQRLADLYDADAMPPQLRKAHRALDDAVDKLYRSAAFTGDRDRAEHLFGLYERLVAPLVAATRRPGPGQTGSPERLRKSAETADRGPAPRKRTLEHRRGTSQSRAAVSSGETRGMSPPLVGAGHARPALLRNKSDGRGSRASPGGRQGCGAGKARSRAAISS